MTATDYCTSLIREHLFRLADEIEHACQLNHQDAENFFVELLSIVYGATFSNLNQRRKITTPWILPMMPYKSAYR